MFDIELQVNQYFQALLYHHSPDAELTKDDEKHALPIFLYFRAIRFPELLLYAHSHGIELDLSETETLIGDEQRRSAITRLPWYLTRERISTIKVRGKRQVWGKELRYRCSTCKRLGEWIVREISKADVQQIK